nr:uncharacterized protein LOC109398466 isoform X1 [Aedes albopictus]
MKISCIIYTASIVAVLGLILITKPCSGAFVASAMTASSGDNPPDHDHDDIPNLVPVPLIAPNGTDLPRPYRNPTGPVPGSAEAAETQGLNQTTQASPKHQSSQQQQQQQQYHSSHNLQEPPRPTETQAETHHAECATIGRP